jgi:hypothetical protein
MKKTHFNLWTRLESRTRDEDIRESLQARVHDPYWLLGRQWQVGEFRGADGGTLAWATIQATSDRLSAYRPHTQEDAFQVDMSALPLEVVVEGEASTHPDIPLLIQAGLRWQRQLAAHGVPPAVRQQFRDEYPLAFNTDDPRLVPREARRLRVMQGRIPDARTLQQALLQTMQRGAVNLELLFKRGRRNLEHVLRTGMQRLGLSTVDLLSSRLSVQALFAAGIVPDGTEVSMEKLLTLSNSELPVGRLLTVGLEQVNIHPDELMDTDVIRTSLAQMWLAWMERMEI